MEDWIGSLREAISLSNKAKNTPNVRAAAAKVLHAVMDKGNSLSDALPSEQKRVADKDQALLQEICFGAIRLFPRYDALANQLFSKKMKGKQRVFHHLLIVGLYQIEQMRIPEHAAVGETVQATNALKAPGLKGLINACLRNFLRNRQTLESKITNDVVTYSHPSWFIKRIKNAYPTDWKSILENNLQRAPMWLRVHQSNQDVEDFISQLKEADIEYSQPLTNPSSILLEKPKSVERLPGFEQGYFAVQDAAAQHAAILLEAQNDELVLDACTAPGGKACHILDLANCKLVAADVDEVRLGRVKENLQRLQLTADLVCGDLSDASTLASYPQFDRILLDAPCSATGVIRRHPDIKWLRRNEDIEQLATLQRQILNTMWQKLKPGGTLLYATCSILPEENKLQMLSFLAENPDAEWQPIDNVLNKNESIDAPGWQILPGEHSMDGFYYCRLKKTQ